MRAIGGLFPMLVLLLVVVAVSMGRRGASVRGRTAGTGDVAPSATPAAARPVGIPALAEALGYLGGMLAVSGLALIVIDAWPDLATAGRLAVSGLAAVGLLIAGRLAPEHADPALTRLRWFLWLAGTAASALFAGVAVDALDRADVTVALGAAATTAAVGGVLWRGHDRPLQLLCFLGGTAVAAGALVLEVASAGVAGLAVWGVGAAFVVVGLLARRTSAPLLFGGGGGLATLVGAAMAGSEWEGRGLLFLVATGLALLGLSQASALRMDRAEHLVLGILGGVTLLQGLPATIGWFAEQAGVATGLVTMVVGAGVLAAGLRALTRQSHATQVFGGAAMLVGAGVTAAQVAGLGPLLGMATAIALVALGTRQREGRMSAVGSLGLLVFVPWAISHFFPGEGTVPLATVVTGAMFVALAVWLTRFTRMPTRRRPGSRPA
ncbi:MAG TPA: hypothetical protein VFV32_15170 [Acidimicrobiales bacterium]|nr:hypothetical protein [Acidimicrobiales bacterium]